MNLTDPQRDLVVRILRQAGATPGSPALTSASRGVTRTYAQTVQDARTVAAQVRSVAHQGDRVILLSDDEPEVYIGLLGCALAGVVPAVVDAASPAATVAAGADAVGAVAIVTREGLSPVPSVAGLPVLRVPTTPGNGTTVQDRHPDGDAAPDSPLLMLFTSGTTGVPKSVILSRSALHAIPDALRQHGLDWITWLPGEPIYTPLPVAHIGGVWWILNGLVAGCHCVTGATPGAGLGETLGRWRIATVCMVPTLLHRLATEFRNAEVTALPDLRLVVYGGSRAIAEDVSLLELTGARTAQIFGLSETGCTALCLPTGPGSVDRVRRGQVGRPYPGVDILVLADPAETPTTDRRSDPEGTLWIRTPAAMLGYHADPAATAAALVDGWVNTGDRVTVDGDGFITLRGRVSELIICGGANVMPDDVDRIAVTVHGVKDAASFEIPDPSFGAVVGLAVVPTDPQAQEGTGSGRKLKRSVAAEYRFRAEAEARPAHIVIVDRIPRTASGKVRRGELTARFTGRSESVVTR